MRYFLCILIAQAMLVGCASWRAADAQLGQNGLASMKVRALFGFHSDWERRFSISNGTRSLSIDLFEDTGWWRGSHLYIDRAGAYFVHEGQAGCFSFSIEPLTFGADSAPACNNADKSLDEAVNRPSHLSYPASKYYEGLYYVGRFVEGSIAGADMAIVFQGHAVHPEIQLPDPL